MTSAKIWRKMPEYYELVGKECEKCGVLFFPARPICKKCGSSKLQDHKLEGQGVIKTFTIIRTPIAGDDVLEKIICEIPYALAIVQLSEGPCLTAQIVDCEADEVVIGKNVEVVFRKVFESGRKGAICYGYKFRLSE